MMLWNAIYPMTRGQGALYMQILQRALAKGKDSGMMLYKQGVKAEEKSDAECKEGVGTGL